MLTHHTADAQVTTENEPAFLQSVTLTPAAAAATVEIRDGAAAGTIRATLQAAANGNSVQAVFSNALFEDGIYVNITGAGAAVAVEASE